MTLQRLVAEGRLTAPPASARLALGDDGTGHAAAALGWLHVNCGTSCHNRRSDATAWATGLFLRLDARELDGRAANAFDSLTTTLGVAATTAGWRGQTRIAPGHPEGSLLLRLVRTRGQGNQMPPIATAVVDANAVDQVETWIASMNLGAAVDAGAPGL